MRSFVLLALLLAGCTTYATDMSRADNDVRSEPPRTSGSKETKPSKEKPTTTAPTAFGYNATISASDARHTLEMFKEDVDDIAAGGLAWIRIALPTWDAVSSWAPDRIEWNEQSLKVYDAALDYAQKKNVRTFFVVFGIESGDFPLEDYRKGTELYWQGLAKRFGARVAAWQLFNEADGWHYRHPGEDLPEVIPDDYLAELSSLIGMGGEIIHMAKPDALVTTNSSGWPVNDATEARWTRYFDGLAKSVDLVSMDLYPVNSEKALASLPTRIERMQKRYGKPVAVAEIGIATKGGDWTEEDQKISLPIAIEKLKEAKTAIILPYDFRDRGTDPAEGEDNFGIKRLDGSHKPGFDAVMAALR